MQIRPPDADPRSAGAPLQRRRSGTRAHHRIGAAACPGPAPAAQTRTLAGNQGLYNGFLVAALVLGLVGPADHRFAFAVFGLGCVVVAGLYGAATASRRILLVQALPGALALVAQLIAR